ncbi:hypothetical protein FRB90_011536 [Tulasnella sp. 427]|nr:hypothetical protein FRB90_011536 [Tulasnella sp. 427]
MIDSTPFRSSSVRHAKETRRLLVLHVSHLRTLEVWRVPLEILRIMFDWLVELSTPQFRRLTVKSHKSTAWSGTSGNSTSRDQAYARYEAIQRASVLPTQVTGVFKGVSAYDHAKSVQETLLLLPDLQYLLVGDGHLCSVCRDVNTLQLLPDVLPPPITHKALIHASFGAESICPDTIMGSLVLPKLRYVIDMD